MFDWKILAASFAALLIVSSVLVGGFGFSDILEKLGDWMGESPLSGLVTAPLAGSTEVSITFYPNSFDISVDNTAFSSGESRFRAFTGTIKANFTSDRIELVQKDTGFRATLPLTTTVLEDVSIGRMSLKKTTFSVTSDSLETSGENVSLEITGFSGDVTITRDRVLLEGNVTSVRGNGRDII